MFRLWFLSGSPTLGFWVLYEWAASISTLEWWLLSKPVTDGSKTLYEWDVLFLFKSNFIFVGFEATVAAFIIGADVNGTLFLSSWREWYIISFKLTWMVHYFFQADVNGILFLSSWREWYIISFKLTWMVHYFFQADVNGTLFLSRWREWYIISFKLTWMVHYFFQADVNGTLFLSNISLSCRYFKWRTLSSEVLSWSRFHTPCLISSV